MSSITPVMFDKYLLLDRIAVGGMAEVYRAKRIGEKGFEKPVVVKKLLPHLIEDKDMENLLIDEARLAAKLEHENIIHVHDFGILSDTLFIVMEYLFGKDLNQVIKKGGETGPPIDLENTLYLIAAICEGLGYAHRLKDLEGNHLHIIHRDISPHNVFITYEGQVKLIDFGIAKAANRSTKTQTGIIKGKVAYMSPEQAEGKKIDHRSDIFPIGIMLYELLTHQKMFAGDTFQVLSQVIQAKYEPPENIVPDLPKKLCDIIHKALQKEPDERYPSCEAMADDIQDCIYDLQYRPGPKKMAAYMQTLYEGQYEREKQAMAGKMKPELPAETGLPPGAGENHDYQPTAAIDVRSAASAGTQATAATNDLPVSSEVGIQSTVDNTDSDIMGNDDITQAIGHTNGKGIDAGETGRRKRPAPLWITVASLLVLLGLAASYFFRPQDEKALIISQFQQNAEKSIREGRILSPANDSSFYYYGEILKINPENRKAKEGLHEVVDECIRLAEAEIDAADIQSARNHLQTGRSIDPGNKRIQELEDLLVEMERQPAEKPATPEQESSKQPPGTRTKVEREVRSVVNHVKSIFK